MSAISRLERTLYRLQAQKLCLDWAFGAIRDTPGPVVELGLGHGRTYDHMRRGLPGREIHVFDRANHAAEDCQPDPAFLFLGEIAEQLPAASEALAGRVVLANSDIGSFDRESNERVAEMASRLLPPIMAPGGYVMSDLPLRMDGFDEAPLPDGAPEGRYYLYRRRV